MDPDHEPDNQQNLTNSLSQSYPSKNSIKLVHSLSDILHTHKQSQRLTVDLLCDCRRLKVVYLHLLPAWLTRVISVAFSFHLTKIECNKQGSHASCKVLNFY